MAHSEPTIRIDVHGVHKRFGSTVALDNVSMQVARGEVHALVGENGAGKSTLMRILSGAEKPDDGAILLDGDRFRPDGTQQARRRGIAMIYQELALAPHLDVEANVMLGLEEQSWGFLRKREHRRRVRDALALLSRPEIQPSTPVRLLSPGQQQLVEIARALVTDAKVIIFDEPTSSLTHDDTEHLFELIHRLKSRGVSILYVSHFLEEVQRIADRCTVLRDGRHVATSVVAETSQSEIVRQMVGRELEELFPKVPHAIGDVVLESIDLSGSKLPIDVNLTLRRGEILGLFGLIGAGRTELMRILFGLDAAEMGSVCLRDREWRRRAPGTMIAQGMGLLSENRKDEGLALNRSVADNLTYGRLAPYLTGPFLRLSKRRRAVEQRLAQLHVRHRHPEQPVGELSGGNQQKVALARLLHLEADVLLLDEPTRGVDVGSKVEIYQLMGELAAQGKAILFVSSYLPELLGVCDSLAVMQRGRLSAARPVGEWTEESIMAVATGGGDH